ncbi:hypothetical protein [Streptomyces chiangmaiensis]|uniref:Uncharacterized protein n=1 Tax=Streptomyces chiangmaiensis TaxID=766497 RepID=A0ABU7FDI2_9ACTN|nr:hypothetical protein [Streptomyces chiangmaiensis]MED7822221.1 hypothetical protein [Streptomyces chiangmaiensis]
MTACAFTTATAEGDEWAARPGCVLTADGSYAARLALDDGSWYPERWTLDGPEPYAVPLPGNQPEEPGTEVQPMADGRVLIHRVAAGRHTFSLLYPTGPGTGELPLGAVQCPQDGTRMRLLPPAPTGDRAFALAVDRGSTAVWQVAGGPGGPERPAQLPGRCSGGVWLDRAGRMLALDRTPPDGGPTKTVVVDLARGGEVSPLLQIADRSHDRLLLADPDSGLLLIRSDAPSPGQHRLGWGVLGSTLPVRFPECLRLNCPATPFAIQPGQALMPESCAVALRIDGAAGSWVGVWRPADRRVHHLPAPEGWLTGAGLWTRDGVLRLPFATRSVRCAVARVVPPAAAPAPPTREPGRRPVPKPPEDRTSRPVPLQQALAPRGGRTERTPLVWVRRKQTPVGSTSGAAGKGDGRGSAPPAPGAAVVAAR